MNTYPVPTAPPIWVGFAYRADPGVNADAHFERRRASKQVKALAGGRQPLVVGYLKAHWPDIRRNDLTGAAWA